MSDHIGPSPGRTIEQDFLNFHAENPWVYLHLVALARQGVAAGARKLGIGMLFEVLRWQVLTDTRRDHTGFKLNNNYRSYYAREIMRREPNLAGIFEVRRLHDGSEDLLVSAV